MLPKRKNARGFTLVEVIVVLVILALLAAILIPSMVGWIEKAREKTVHTELHTLALAAQSAYAETYAECGLDGSEQIYYNPSQPSGDARDQVFARHLEEYLAGLPDWSGATSVAVMFAGKDALGITYGKDGVTYSYLRDGSGVKITKY
ncbi:MAG: prepilin-type N-terminal cleavage/methylation domain-containing protein [Clostridia bacterium]|nr:prepilin-type N-terminal cleavage/methylation domain-containing protein [Clostridia bacterium]